MMVVLVSAFGGTALLAVLALGLLSAGLRAGDRPGDATVTALLASAGQPGEPRPVVIVTVRNPGDVPLIAGLSARRRRIPGWPDGGMRVYSPRRTTRRRFRAQANDVVGVVPAGSDAEFAVPVAKLARGYLLTAAIGQSGYRLRVFRVPVANRYRSASAGGAALPYPSVGDGRLP